MRRSLLIFDTLTTNVAPAPGPHALFSAKKHVAARHAHAEGEVEYPAVSPVNQRDSGSRGAVGSVPFVADRVDHLLHGSPRGVV